jgi:hypothetical protein
MGDKARIAKEKWVEIKEALGAQYANIVFMLDGHKISVSRQTITRGLTKKGFIVVYIDGEIKGSWTEENMPIVKKVWCTTTKPLLTKKQEEKYIRILGKRGFQKSNIFKQTHTYTSWSFSSITKFIAQYKKLDGLELVSIDCYF